METIKFIETEYEFTKEELAFEAFEHNLNKVYDNDTDSYKTTEFSLEQLENMDTLELAQLFDEFCSWGSTIVIE